MKTFQRAAIINWKTFINAGLAKSRKTYNYGLRKISDGADYEECVVYSGKKSLLTAEHFIVFNYLRGLPLNRGFQNLDSFEEILDRLIGTLSNVNTKEAKIAELGLPFACGNWWLSSDKFLLALKCQSLRWRNWKTQQA